jgi:hypothetical protein
MHCKIQCGWFSLLLILCHVDAKTNVIGYACRTLHFSSHMH